MHKAKLLFGALERRKNHFVHQWLMHYRHNPKSVDVCRKLLWEEGGTPEEPALFFLQRNSVCISFRDSQLLSCMSTECIAVRESSHHRTCILPRKTGDGQFRASFVAFHLSSAWVCHGCRGAFLYLQIFFQSHLEGLDVNFTNTDVGVHC